MVILATCFLTEIKNLLRERNKQLRRNRNNNKKIVDGGEQDIELKRSNF
jgi:hypothetical protein